MKRKSILRGIRGSLSLAILVWVLVAIGCNSVAVRESEGASLLTYKLWEVSWLFELGKGVIIFGR